MREPLLASSRGILAKRLDRDYKNVHTDVTQLAVLRLIERQPDGRVAVPWELIRAELKL